MMKKRLLSLLLALVMALSVFPMTVLAEDEEGVVPESVNEVESTELEEENEGIIQEEPESVEKTTESGEDTAEQGTDESEDQTEDPEEPKQEEKAEQVDNEPEQVKEEKTEQEATEETFASLFTAPLSQDSVETPPTDAVAYVTVGEGDAKVPIQASDYDEEETADVVEQAGYFKTLEAAVAACPVNKNASDKADNAAAAEAGAVTIKMLKGVLIKSNSCMTIAKGQNIIIDLAGCDIAQECQTNAGSYVFYVSGILTIKDSTDTDADGEDCGSIYNYAGWTVSSDKPWGSSGYGFCNDLIQQRSGSTVTIESGELKNNGNYCPYCIDVHDGNTVTNIKGGWLHSPTSSSIRVIAYNSKNNNPQVLNISGGHLGSPTDVATLWCQTTNNTAKLYTTVNISGGLIQVRGNGSNYAISDDGGAQGMCYNITGGTVDCGTDGYAFYTNGADVNITGGTLGGLFAIKCTTEEENVKISGGTFKGKLSVFGQYAKKGFVTGGNFVNQTNYDDAETLYVKADGSIWFKTRYFSEQDLTGKRYKCLQDYVDDGYVIHAKFGLNVKNKDDKDAGYSRLEQFDICTKDNERTIDTVYIYETAEGWRTTPEERQRKFLKVEEIYEQNPAEYRFRDYSGYTCGYINWAIENYGAGLTITQEDYDNTTFASGYDWSYTNCKDLAILNDRVYRSFVSWGSGSSYYGTEQKPGGWAYKQVAGNLAAWESAGYILEKHGQEGAYTQYYAYKSLGGSSLIAEGYVDKTNAENPNTYDVVPVEVNLGKATVEEETIKVKNEEITVTYKGEENAGTGEEEDDKPTIVEAADAITETLQNSSVSGFLDTKIDDSTKTNDEAIKNRMIEQIAAEDAEIKEALEEAIKEATINSETETKYDKRVDVDLKVADVIKTTSVETSTSATTTLKVAVFDVQPNAKVTVKLTNTDTGEVITEKTYETPIQNDEITDAIAFRVPVNYKESAHAVKVWHKAKDQGMPTAGVESTYGDPQGLKFVQTAANGDKFVQLESNHFSYWTYEIVEVEANAVVVILDEENNYRSFESLAAAIADWKSVGNEDDVTMILMQDITGAFKEDDPSTEEVDESKEYDPFDFGGEKEIALDLNGHILKGAVENADKVTVSNADSSKQTTLAATGVYANNVKAFVMDGYDVKTTTVENDTVFSTTEAGVFTVRVVPVPGSYTDRDSVTEGIDLYAGDTVKMDVRVYGAKFVGADVTLYYDKANFKMTDAPTSGWDGDVKWYDSDESKLAGKTRFYAAKSTQGGASSYYELNKKDENGAYYSLGTFEFEALPGANEAMNVAFQVEPTATGEIGRDGTTSGQEVAPVYVAGAWSQGWDNSPANKLTQGADDTHLVNALVNVRLKSMSAVVNGETGLVYNATARNLVKSDAGAKDSITQQAIPTPTIKYAVLSKADADGTLWTEGCGEEKSSTNEAYISGKEPKVPADNAYTAAIPQQTNAGDYVVFYRVSKDGYITVADKLNVSIAKKDVDLNWTCTDPMTTGDGKSEEYVSNFKVTYKENNTEGFTAPTAKYANAGSGDPLTATVTLTSFNDADPVAGTQLIKVGKYVYTATVDPNYNIKSGETAVVELEGSVITGYTLTAKNNTEAAPTIGNVWYDGAAHTPAQLNAKDATADVTKTYYVLKPGESDWEKVEGDTIPAFTAAGTYQVKAVLTKDSYYDLTLDTVTFTIKAATYVVEKFDWVTGWDVVLVHTNDTVPGFTYDGAKMYDVSKLGYKYGTTKNADGTVGTQGYTKVFGLVIAGDADITKVKSSNETALGINYSNMSGSTQGGVAWARLDVNSSSSVELLDLVFVQGVYNVNETYMAEQMAIVLKSDVNGDKMVDTRDCALIKANS